MSNETARYRRRWSAAFHRAAALMPLQLQAIFVTGQRQLMLRVSASTRIPMEESSNASSSTGSIPEYRRSDPHGPALTGCSVIIIRCAHVVTMTITQLAAIPTRNTAPRSFAIARSRPLARDPDNETVTPGCVRSGSDPAERCQAKFFANRSFGCFNSRQIASTVLFRVEN